MINHDPIVIVGYKRTPMGNLLGELAALSAPELGHYAIKGAIQSAQLSIEAIQSVIMGCVLPAGLGQAPARQAALMAGIPMHASCTTVNKMCGSGMQAIILAHDQLRADSYDFMIAGGFESMTNAPYLLKKARGGYRLGHGELLDHLFLDGLEDAYQKGRLMGVFAEDTAAKYQFTREIQDNFAITSLSRAKQATEDGTFAKEIIPVTVKTKKQEIMIEKDEGPEKASLEKIKELKPAFKAEGTVTAANSSSISDGAAALVLTRESIAIKKGIQPIAKIIGHSTFAHEPAWFSTAPIGAIKRLYEKTGWNNQSIDLFEINEAFACVTLAAIHELNLNPEKVNIHGGACALGHPIGASGARIMVTLLNALQKYQLQRGIATLCIGGGEATAIAVEMYNS